MPVPIIQMGDEIEVRLFTRDAEQLGINVLHYRCFGVTGAGASVQDAAIDLEAIFAPLYKPLLPSNVQWYGLGARKIYPAPKSLEYHSFALQGNGTSGSANGLPRQSAALIGKHTDTPGPGGRGRFYTAFPDSSQSSGQGLVSGAAITLLTALGTAIIANQLATGAGISSSLEPGLWKTATSTHTHLTGFSVTGFFATMKKRGSYGRANSLPF